MVLKQKNQLLSKLILFFDGTNFVTFATNNLIWKQIKMYPRKAF